LDVSEGALERQAGPMMIGHEFDTPVAPKPATPKKKGAARDRSATAQAANALASLSDPKPSDPDDPRKAVRFSSPTKLTKEEREAKLACVNEAVAMSAEMSRPSSRNVLRVKDGYGQAGGDTIPSDDNGARPSTEGRPHTHATFASVGGDSVLPAGRSIADSDSDYGVPVVDICCCGAVLMVCFPVSDKQVMTGKWTSWVRTSCLQAGPCPLSAPRFRFSASFFGGFSPLLRFNPSFPLLLCDLILQRKHRSRWTCVKRCPRRRTA
jgi:hypothetical protein